MKLAIEHLQQAIAQTERALGDSRNAVAASQRQLEEHKSSAEGLSRKLSDLTAALAVLRAPASTSVEVAQLVKTQISDKGSQRPILSRSKAS